jgi:hypothetical protein
MVTGIEFVVGCLAAWAWRKARRVAGRADAEVDQALDAGLDRLHDLVAARLGGEPALSRLESEAASGGDAPGVRSRTGERVRLALEDAAEADEAFADRLAELAEQLRAAESRPGGWGVAVSASGPRAVAAGGDVSGIASSGEGAVNIQRR